MKAKIKFTNEKYPNDKIIINNKKLKKKIKKIEEKKRIAQSEKQAIIKLLDNSESFTYTELDGNSIIVVFKIKNNYESNKKNNTTDKQTYL